jgi:2-polyprenyl-3-methyl-5-hydroxy-6-metoxy-1,4-benzoquinol methylase
MERIAFENWESERGHIQRYELVRDYLKHDDIILDAACGIGYGQKVLGLGTYIGVDKYNVVEFKGDYRVADLDYWKPEFKFTIGICFETLEHLRNPKRWLKIMLKARRYVFISVPTIPTKHFNEFHLHDFTEQEILSWLKGYDVKVIKQPEEFSHIFIIKKHEYKKTKNSKSYGMDKFARKLTKFKN